MSIYRQSICHIDISNRAIAGQFYGVICCSEHGRLHSRSSSLQLYNAGLAGTLLDSRTEVPISLQIICARENAVWGRNGVNALANQFFLRTNLICTIQEFAKVVLLYNFKIPIMLLSVETQHGEFAEICKGVSAL